MYWHKRNVQHEKVYLQCEKTTQAHEGFIYEECSRKGKEGLPNPAFPESKRERESEKE